MALASRPASCSHVPARSEPGHWEGDTVYSSRDGSKECLLTLVERKTRCAVVPKIPDRGASSLKAAFDRIGRAFGAVRFRDVFKLVTSDNGGKFSDVDGMERSALTKGMRTSLYSAHPYCSCELGTNENHNGIIRRFLPKGTGFALIKARKVKGIQDWMNTYPRRILDGFTLLDMFRQEFGFGSSNSRIMEARC